MNLFCFSLEGSMDSLYEAAGDSPPQPVPRRSCSPALLLDDDVRWKGSGRSISMEMTMRPGTSAQKKKRRTQVSKSSSDNEALDNAVCNVAVWKAANGPEDLRVVPIANNHNEELKKMKHRGDGKGGKSAHHSGTKKRDKNCPSQKINTKGAATELKPAAKRNPKLGKKQTGKNGKEGTKKSHNTTGHPAAGPSSPPTEPHYLDVLYRCDRRIYLGKSSTLPTQENTTPGPDMISSSGGATPTHYHNHSQNQRWSNPADKCPGWGTVEHTCRRPLTEYRVSSDDFSLLRGDKMHEQENKDGGPSTNCKNPTPSNVTRSITELDLSEPNMTIYDHMSPHDQTCSAV
ncbi:uncharacterized protein LOC133504929 [Syngnathoides biaculeatus]|uniref:uncharacterized protein LOC133504929 n=1 Tax=Syngnathoides biaculeatus TaxID=300417 RepID=UPI002ADE7E7F|nr:uncharacterized protein LOC133504929 [Syngnathoides biaculeatus]